MFKVKKVEMATDVCNQSHETNNKLCNGMSRVSISIQPDEQEELDIVSLSDRVYPTFREEVRNFLQAIDVNDGFDETLEIEKAERWLEWANRLKYLKIVSTDIPYFILPNNCSGKLIDVKVFCKRGPDDHIFDTYKMVRDRDLTAGVYPFPRCGTLKCIYQLLVKTYLHLSMVVLFLSIGGFTNIDRIDASSKVGVCLPKRHSSPRNKTIVKKQRDQQARTFRRS